jgi:hypothetical protein
MTEGTLFASVSFLTGSDLNHKIATLYRSVAAVLDNERDPDADGVGVVLGTASNKVSRVYPAYVAKAELGRCHVVIRLAADVPDE